MSLTPNSSTPPETGSYEGFSYEIFDANSTTATVKIHLPPGGVVKAIPGCMVATSSGVAIAGKLKRTARALLGPDSARSQTLTASEDGPGWVLLAPSFPGSLRAVRVRPGEADLCVGDDAFLVSIGDVESTAKRQSVGKALFSGHGLYVKHVHGDGLVFVAGVGSMMQLELKTAEETAVVDNGHLVTWPSDVKQEVKKATKSWFGSGVSGEGVVTKITGPAQIVVQTRNAEEIAGWIYDAKTPA